jgi:hypothetical protein
MNGVRLGEEIRGYFTDAPCPSGACDDCGCECCSVGSVCMQATPGALASGHPVSRVLGLEGGPA